MTIIHRLRGLSVSPRARGSDTTSFKSAVPTKSRDEPLRVLWTTPHGRAGKGGMDRLTQLVAKAVEYTGTGSVVLTCLTTKGRFGKTAGAFVFGFAIFRFILFAVTRHVDVLHINVAAYGSAYRKMLLGRIARLLKVPYIVHIHSGRFPGFWEHSPPAIRRALDAFLLHSSIIIVLGRDFEEVVLYRIPAAQGRVRLMYNATPSRESAQHPSNRGGKLQLTTLGLLGPNKNTTQLIEALGHLRHRHDWTATIAGNGEVERARAQVKELGIGGRVSVPGWIDQHAAQKLLEQTDIFLLPSLSEGLPMAILEAFSHGVAVIASAVNSIPEVISNGRNGLLVPPGDLAALVKAISRLLDDPGLRHALGQQALRDHKAHYELDGYMKRLQCVWRQAALSRPRWIA